MKNFDKGIIGLSQKLLLAAKMQEDTKEMEENLKNINLSGLKNDAEKMVLWINIYNAFTQIFLQRNPELYKKQFVFFAKKQIHIASQILSLNNIEHGILRRSKNQLSLGYFNNIWISDFEKKNRVDKLDYRIHFALNCGANSCPPIAFYQIENLEKQLNQATASYLEQSIKYNSETKILKVPRLMFWFRADFGGRKGFEKLIKDLDLVPKNDSIKISYQTWDWDLKLQNFQDSSS